MDKKNKKMLSAKKIMMEQIKSKPAVSSPVLKTKEPVSSPILKTKPSVSSPVLKSLGPLSIKIEKAKIKPEMEDEDEEDFNAASSEGEKFKVEKTPEGFWAESGVAKEKYLKAIGKLKNRKKIKGE